MKTRDKVERVLQVNDKARNDRMLLNLAVWEIEGLGLSETQKQKFLDKCSSPESIARYNRELKDKYPPSEKVSEYRYQQFQSYQDRYSTRHNKMWDEVQ